MLKLQELALADPHTMLAAARATKRQAASNDLGSSSQARSSPPGSGGTRITVWKLPSPTWPTTAPVSPEARMSSLVAQDRLVEPRDRHDRVRGKPLMARAAAPVPPIRASCRACHSFSRSVGVGGPAEPGAPKPAAISSACLACSATAAGVPWNSKNRLGRASRPCSFEYAMQAAICTSSRNSIRATGMPDLHDRDRGLHGVAQSRELAGRGRRSPRGCHIAGAVFR